LGSIVSCHPEETLERKSCHSENKSLRFFFLKCGGGELRLLVVVMG